MNAVIILFLIAPLVSGTPVYHREEVQSNPCEYEPNGYTLPVPDSCTDFYLCLNEKPIQQTCGLLYFNPKTHSCDLPYKVDCNKSLVVLQASSTKHICDGRPNADLIASIENCSDFFVCIGGVALSRTCGWMHFNAETGRCVDQRYSKCDQQQLSPKRRPMVKLQMSGKPVAVPILLV